MKIKVMDIVYCPNRNLFGQIHRIRRVDVQIKFVTGDLISIHINRITWNKDHWRIND